MWKCNECIHINNLDNKQGICIGKCKEVFSRLNKENFCYQEIVPKPINCGNCQYIRDINNKPYCSVMDWNHDDRYIYHKPVRLNYLTKNTPKWCPLRNEIKHCK